MLKKLPLLVNATLALLVLATMVYATPYTVSALFLFRGSDALDKSLRSTGQELTVDNITLQSAVRPAPDSPGSFLLTHAIGDLQQAIRWDRRNERAYRGLVKAYYLKRDLPAAVGPLAELGRLYPDDRTLHLELGDALKAAGRVEEAMREWTYAGIAVANPTSAPVRGGVRVRAEEVGGPPEWGGNLPKIVEAGITHVALFTNGCLNRGLYFPQAGTYNLRVRAYNTPPGPAQLNIQVDGQLVRRFEYDSRIWMEATAIERLDLNAGLHRFDLCFANDYQGALGDRNVYLEWFELQLAP